jgi:adenine-specific DNA-methyltransferase
MQNLLDELKTLLATQARFTEDGKMIKQAVIDASQNLDAELLQLLLSNELIKKHFFREVGNFFVFDKVKLLRFVSNKAFLEDSYTAFKNKIGLAHKNSDGMYDAYLKEQKEIVLAFPYKDCMLEGGQTKETQKRNELFWNETLAPDDIDRLKTPKAFAKIRKHEAGTDLTPENLNLNDNYIIKGNNLLALYSLLPVYRGQVKLIYIDPPYNTGNDGFQYNDSFNHSTWLTFMKNRLEVARELLSESGSIFISLDDKEFAYLKVLCDEIFGQTNFLADIIWNSTKSVTNTAIISVAHTHNLVYFKNIEYIVKNRTEFRLKEDGTGFSNPDKDIRGVWKADPFQVGGWRPNQQYEITNPNTGVVYKPNEGCSWKNDFQKFQYLLNDNRIVFGVDGKGSPQRKRFLSEALERGKVAKTIWDDVGTTTNGTQHLNQLFERNLFANPKPETFIQKIIELATKENDLVLDFHLGSGTTAAVAHKMGRRYIGIEQMDYIETIVVERLKKVVLGEQGGISKAVNWQGGGSFVYMELAVANQKYIDKIQAIENDDAELALQSLYKIWDSMKAEAFMSHKITVDSFDKNAKSFEGLSFEDKKRFLIESLDKNMLYVPACDMESAEFGMEAIDKAFTKQFYRT